MWPDFGKPTKLSHLVFQEAQILGSFWSHNGSLMLDCSHATFTVYVTVSAKTVLNGTFSITRNTNLRYWNCCGLVVLDCSHASSYLAIVFYNYFCYVATPCSSWILSNFSHRNCNNTNGTYKRMGRREGLVWAVKEGGQPKGPVTGHKFCGQLYKSFKSWIPADV